MNKYYITLIVILLQIMAGVVWYLFKTWEETGNAANDLHAAISVTTERAEKACEQARQEVVEGKATMTQFLATRCRP